jgi:hypothetical protein
MSDFVGRVPPHNTQYQNQTPVDDTQLPIPVARGARSGTAGATGSIPAAVANNAATTSTAAALAPTSGVSASDLGHALGISSARFANAAAVLAPSVALAGLSDEISVALSPVAMLRKLFAAMLENNENQQDDALEQRKQALEADKTLKYKSADASEDLAGKMSSNAGISLGVNLAASAATAAAPMLSKLDSGMDASGKLAAGNDAANAATDAGASAADMAKAQDAAQAAYVPGGILKSIIPELDPASKGLTAYAGYTDTQTQVSQQEVNAFSARNDAAADSVKTKQADADGTMQKLRDLFAQMSATMKDIQDSKAQTVGVRLA